jgi:hypothetical protein
MVMLVEMFKISFMRSLSGQLFREVAIGKHQVGDNVFQESARCKHIEY